MLGIIPPSNVLLVVVCGGVAVLVEDAFPILLSFVESVANASKFGLYRTGSDPGSSVDANGS